MASPSLRSLQTILPLKQKLDRLYRETNRPEFILTDPVQFVHKFSPGPDQEIAAFLTATIAWGRRDLILKSAEKMFALMGQSPFAFVMKGKYRKPGGHSPHPGSRGLCMCPFGPRTQGNDCTGRSRGLCMRPSGPRTQGNDCTGRSRGLCIHRTFFESDLWYFCKGFKACYAKYGSLEAVFASAENVWEGIHRFRETMAAANCSSANCSLENGGNYTKHIASPATNSACKRLHLALRWLVRKEGPVDLGLWKSISPSSLFIPLDLHVGRSARQLGLLESGRKANDKKAVISLTEKLREFCPEDPVKYDLALFGYSVDRLMTRPFSKKIN